jgi:FAD dependent oxidoreductase TIGR03364
MSNATSSIIRYPLDSADFRWHSDDSAPHREQDPHTVTETIATCDVLIVGAGIVGLAHADEARRRGLTVVVIDRDARAVGASVRNFGHCCVTAQAGDLLELAHTARESWLRLSAAAGFFSVESGAVAVAQTATELAVLEELAAQREPGELALLTRDQLRDRVPAIEGDAVVGGAMLRDDLRVDPREAVASLAAWLERQPGIDFRWRTSFLGAANGVAETSRGRIHAERVIVCVGHDLDYLYPETADANAVERCGLVMARVLPEHPITLGPAVLTGTSMLRYPAFTATASSELLRAELERTDPELIDIAANVMFTQRPDGSIIVGDSHAYDATMPPFLAEPTADILLRRISDVLGGGSHGVGSRGAGSRGAGRLRVVERWQGVYASSALHPYLIAEPETGVTAVAVTSGVGMTISLGLAPRVFDSF